MKVSFSGQPFPDHSADGRLGDIIQSVLADQQIESFDVASAWVKRSGLARIAPQLKTFRDRGGVASAIIGIDEGGATRQGLELALELFDEVFVYHDNSWRTFHPKVYFANGSDIAYAIIGSTNMTAGGLYSNFEAFVSLELNPGTEDDDTVREQLAAWFATMKADSGRAVRLTANSLKTLLSDSQYRIFDEGAKGAAPTSSAAAETDSILGQTTPNLFQAGIPLLPGAPSVGSATAAVAATNTSQSGATPGNTARPGTANSPTPQPVGGGVAQPASVSAVWTKVLSRADAQRPQAGTAPTGRLTLTQSTHPIDHTTYFRNDFFALLPWQSTTRGGNTYEVAPVTMDVVIRGVSHGSVSFRIDHAQHRVSGQGNVPTWLHWDALNAVLTSGSDLTGALVEISKLSDGTFRMVIR